MNECAFSLLEDKNKRRDVFVDVTRILVRMIVEASSFVRVHSRSLTRFGNHVKVPPTNASTRRIAPSLFRDDFAVYDSTSISRIARIDIVKLLHFANVIGTRNQFGSFSHVIRILDTSAS